MYADRRIPKKDNELHEMAMALVNGAKNSKLFESPAAKAILEALGVKAEQFQEGCEAAKYRDTLKVALRNSLKKELVASMKRVISYIDAMATEEDLNELHRAGVWMTEGSTRKKKSHGDAEPVPAGS